LTNKEIAEHFRCNGCGKEFDTRNDYYMVRDDIWQSVRGDARFLCLGCVEKRLGRKLESDDFTDVIANWENDTVRALFEKAGRKHKPAAWEKLVK